MDNTIKRIEVKSLKASHATKTTINTENPKHGGISLLVSRVLGENQLPLSRQVVLPAGE